MENIDRMRGEFDLGFSRPVVSGLSELESLIAIRVGAHRFAMRVSEINALDVNRKVIPIPSDDPHFRGLAGMQGRLVPVYDLASLLGFEAARPGDARWLAVCGRAEPAGLAFHSFDECLLVEASRIFPLQDESREWRHVTGSLRTDSWTCHVLSVQSILGKLGKQSEVGPSGDI